MINDSETKRTAPPKNTIHLLSGPGIFLQLDGNPWRKIQESQALEDLTAVFIRALTSKTNREASLDTSTTHSREDIDSANGSKSKTDLFSLFTYRTDLKPDSSSYATDTADQYRLPLRQTDFERLASLLRSSQSDTSVANECPVPGTRLHSSRNVSVQVSLADNGTAADWACAPDSICPTPAASTQNQLTKRIASDKPINVSDQTTSTRNEALRMESLADSNEWKKWLQISIGIVLHMFFLRLVDAIF